MLRGIDKDFPMRFSQLMSKIPLKLFNELNGEYQVDRPNHKLTGKSLFQILLYNICEEDRLSLRVIEESFDRHQLRLYHKGKPLKASKSGLSDRLKTVSYEYYEALFLRLRKIFAHELNSTLVSSIKLFDSTVVTLSSKLLQCGFKVPHGEKAQIKFSVGFDGLPQSVCICHEESDASENIALKKAIMQAGVSSRDIVVFDRGLTARKTFQEFKHLGIDFVTRLNDQTHYRTLEDFPLPQDSQGTIEVLEDGLVQLRSKDVHWVKEPFRRIKIMDKEKNKSYSFLTTLLELPALEIAHIYKTRWDIEIFFKFIKQYLNARHFLSRNLNGIKVVFYMILIAALLILTFKKINQIESFKIAKRRFLEQLRRAVTYDIILLYQYNPHEFETAFSF